MSKQEEEGEIILVGTSHVSEKSVEEVERVIDEEEPDFVAVELDEQRYKSIKGDGPDDLDAKDLIKGNKPFESPIRLGPASVVPPDEDGRPFRYRTRCRDDGGCQLG
ncbi:MAG: TraB/GumN family protein [Halobacteriales archaeon]|nr:TraB/GumN family protein [Halobacteriales archaeon]